MESFFQDKLFSGTNSDKQADRANHKKLSDFFKLVDVKSITFQKSASDYNKNDLDELANSILKCGGLLKPLVLKMTGIEKYQLLEGEKEFQAVLKAYEKNPGLGEMIDAFVIPQEVEKSILEQLQSLQRESHETVEGNNCVLKALTRDSLKLSENPISGFLLNEENSSTLLENTTSNVSNDKSVQVSEEKVSWPKEKDFYELNRKVDYLASLPETVRCLQNDLKKFENDFEMLRSLPSQISELIKEQFQNLFLSNSGSVVNIRNLGNSENAGKAENKSTSFDQSAGNGQKELTSMDNLDTMGVSQLKAIAKEHGIKGFSKMKKNELVTALKGSQTNRI
ncbi:MAG: Rho termination factor N-terminal domain-containing protein [Candidatus Riflebacteria bacterium]|nr:Rho termination factor N-terminal domain-containing protein [Candidatus Riflebacteria bacterium]